MPDLKMNLTRPHECNDDAVQTTLDTLGEIQKYIKNTGFVEDIVMAYIAGQKKTA